MDLRSQFDCLHCIGVKFSLQTLRALAFQIVNSSFNKSYHGGTMHPGTEISITAKIKSQYLQSFCKIYGIFSRALISKLQLSPTKEELILKEVAFHLGFTCLALRFGELHEDNVENADETRFLINMENGRSLGFKGEKDVK